MNIKSSICGIQHTCINFLIFLIGLITKIECWPVFKQDPIAVVLGNPSGIRALCEDNILLLWTTKNIGNFSQINLMEIIYHIYHMTFVVPRNKFMPSF